MFGPLTLLAAFALTAADNPAASNRPQTHVCVSVPSQVAALGVQNFLADRRGDNRYALPWRDTAPPTVVIDEQLCRRAARAYFADSLGVRADSTLRATVVQAGGLYFVKAHPVRTAGEFELIAVLNDRFEIVKFLTS